MLSEIITALGGPSAVARELGLRDYSSVASWVRRRSIPVKFWPGLLGIAARKRVPLDERRLLEAHTAKARGA